VCGVKILRIARMSALPLAKVKVVTKKQSPTSTAVLLVNVFVSPSSGYGLAAGCGLSTG
jgi:hypothetical protein